MRLRSRYLELAADALDRVAHDPEVIEREGDLVAQHVGDRHQGGIRSVRAARTAPTSRSTAR